MSVRLNKALRELNIGISTAVEFLEKKPSLGEIKSDPNYKINDEQYAALLAQFKRDAEVRTQASQLFQKKKEDKKAEKTTTARGEDLLKKPTQEFKIHGKIDLDNPKANATPSQEAKHEADTKVKETKPAESAKPQPQDQQKAKTEQEQAILQR